MLVQLYLLDMQMFGFSVWFQVAKAVKHVIDLQQGLLFFRGSSCFSVHEFVYI